MKIHKAIQLAVTFKGWNYLNLTSFQKNGTTEKYHGCNQCSIHYECHPYDEEAAEAEKENLFVPPIMGQLLSDVRIPFAFRY